MPVQSRGCRFQSYCSSSCQCRVPRPPELERQAIIDALETCKGNLSKACKALGMGRSTLYRKMEKYGL
ncbi:MAG: helix-turn-helix domain-containing protein [Bacteroidota bacterium]